MEELLVILGLAMMYSWVHGIIIISKKISGTTSYEKVVLWFGVVVFAISMLGIMFP